MISDFQDNESQVQIESQTESTESLPADGRYTSNLKKHNSALRSILKAPGNVRRAQRNVSFIDEFSKRPLVEIRYIEPTPTRTPFSSSIPKRFFVCILIVVIVFVVNVIETKRRKMSNG